MEVGIQLRSMKKETGCDDKHPDIIEANDFIKEFKK
jgi:hypothetical protein